MILLFVLCLCVAVKRACVTVMCVTVSCDDLPIDVGCVM